MFPEEVDGEIFSASEGEVVGPIETDAGTYVFQVDSVTEATTTPFEEARPQIEEQLAGQLQQEAFSAFLSDYRDRWVQLTVCAEDFVIERCDNFTGETQPCPDPSLPEEQQQQQLEQTGCPPPVLSIQSGGPGNLPALHPRERAAPAPPPAGRGHRRAGRAPRGVPAEHRAPCRCSPALRRAPPRRRHRPAAGHRPAARRLPPDAKRRRRA